MATWDEITPHLTGLAHLATVGADGHPHAAKVAPAVEGGWIWMVTRAGSAKARNLAVNPRAALMFEAGSEAYVRAGVEVVDDADEKHRVWHGGLFPFPLDGFFGSPDHPDLLLLRLTPTAVTVMARGDDGPSRLTWRR